MVKIEVLVVPECPHADAASALARAALTAAEMVGGAVTVTLVDSENQAAAIGFVGSPSFLVNGVDPFLGRDRSPAIACRMYWTRSGLSGVPDLDDLVRAVVSSTDRQRR